MAFIKSISELPMWFDLKNYQPAKEEITATNVLSQIIVRKTLFNLITDEDFEYPYEIKASFKAFSLFEAIPDLDIHNVEIVMNQYCGKIPTALNKKNDSVNYAFSELCLDPLLKKPLVDNAVLKQHILAWHYCTQTVLDEYLQHALIEPIKDATIYEIGEKYAMLPNGINLYLQSEFFDYYKDELLDELNDEELEEYRQHEKINPFESITNKDYEGLHQFCTQSFNEYESEIYNEHPYSIKPLISVDLSCPDHLLKEQFEKWLTAQRIKTNKIIQEENLDSDFYIKNSGESILQKVHLYQILAYLDLKIWEHITGNKIKQSVYSHVLYPTGGYDGEFIRKTLKPLVMKLFNPKSKEIAELFALKNMEEFNI